MFDFNVFDNAPLFFPLEDDQQCAVMKLLQCKIDRWESDLAEMAEWRLKKLEKYLKVEMAYYPHTWISNAFKNVFKDEYCPLVENLKATARSIVESGGDKEQLVQPEVLMKVRTFINDMEKILGALCDAYPDETEEYLDTIEVESSASSGGYWDPAEELDPDVM